MLPHLELPQLVTSYCRL